MLKFYNIPNDKAGEGYAFIFIETELGLFSTVSDWGNYGYIWNAPGMEFREFLLRINTDYLFGKLMCGQKDHKTFDSDATRKKILEAIDQAAFSETERQEEKEALEGRCPMEEDDYEGWQSETRLEESFQLGVWQDNPQCTQFCERVWPRFRAMLETELAYEKSTSATPEQAAGDKAFVKRIHDEIEAGDAVKDAALKWWKASVAGEPAAVGELKTACAHLEVLQLKNKEKPDAAR